MAFKYQTGKAINSLTRSVTAGVTNTTGIDTTIYPLAALYDDRLERPYRFVPNGASVFCFDLNMVPNGSCQDLSSWSITAGGTNVAGVSGNGIQLTAGNSAKQSIYVRAGERLRLDSQIKVTAGGTGTVRVIIEDSGLYLTSGGAWQTTPASVFSDTNTAFQSKTINFQIPALHGLSEYLTVTVQFIATTQSCQFDDIYLYPASNFFGVFGSNLPKTEFWESRKHTTLDTGATGTVLAQSFSRIPSNHSLLPTSFDASTYVYERFIKFIAGGVGFSNLSSTFVGSVGEFVVAQLEDLPVNPGSGPLKWEHKIRQARPANKAGQEFPSAQSPWAVRRLTMPFFLESWSSYIKLREELYERSRGGFYPIILVPVEADNASGSQVGSGGFDQSTCIHGRVSGDMDVQQVTPSILMTELTVNETPVSDPLARS